jgi:MscS family membrane protein
MARASFFNANRPTTNLAATVGFASRRKGTNPNTVVAILHDAVLGHPDIIGDPGPKLAALRTFKGLKKKNEDAGTRSKKLASRDRLRAEIMVNRQLDRIIHELQAMISMVKQLEKGGLDTREITDLSKAYKVVVSMVGLRAEEQGRGRRRNTKLVVDKSLNEESLATLIHSWIEIWLTDPNLYPDDREVLHSEWDQKMRFLTTRMTGLYDLIHNPEGHETRVDDRIQDLVTWLDDSFKRTNVMWQEPQVWLTAFNETFIGFNVRYYVDNIRLEHWRRPWRVESELTKEVMRRFKVDGVKLPKAMYRTGDEKTQPGVFIT